jgi:hypothetical protein
LDATAKRKSLAEVECCERKKDVQSFPSAMRELPSIAHPEFYV